LLPKSETNGAFFLDANDNRLCRMSLSLFCGPGKDDLNPTSTQSANEILSRDAKLGAE
jgi:hypothetical protein